jgi:predicted membrane protein (TIGR00267 family)
MGFIPEEQEIAVRRITANKETWLKFMVQEEIGITPGLIDNPFEIGFISALSFLVGALPALLPFFLFEDTSLDLILSIVLVLFFLFILGVSKTKITKVHWLKSGAETLLIGAISCGSGFFLGRMVAQYFH